MCKGFLIAAFLIAVFCKLKAQNLVPNPSFEQKYHCPPSSNAFNRLDAVKNWFQPTDGSADYFNECAKQIDASVPKNGMGYQKAKAGVAYIGLILYSKQAQNYREYLSTKLNEKLKAGNKYHISLYVSLADLSSYAISDIQMLFTPTAINIKSDKNISKAPQLSYSSGQPVTDTTNWTKIEWDYIAKGNEQYLTIGNFDDDNATHLVAVKSAYKSPSSDMTDFNYAYYYIDDVCVSEVKVDGTCDCNPPQKPKEINQEDTIIIQK